MLQELNIGGSLVTSALEEACGTNRSKIREMYNKFGDLGSNKCSLIFFNDLYLVCWTMSFCKVVV
jgi:hypothetical protein